MSSHITEIKNAIKNEKAIVGTQDTLKSLRSGKLSKIFLTSNTPEEIVNKIKRYAKLNNIEVIQLDMPNKELGTICKKSFSISVLAIKGA